MRNLRKKLLFTLVALVLALGIATGVQAGAVPTVLTDKADYSPGETVIITGSGFDTNIELMVRVTRPDNSVITGDGSGTQGSDIVTTDSAGSFTYYYILDGILGLYTVEILCGDGILATTTFTDGKPLFTATIAPTTASACQTQTYNITITNVSEPPGNKLGSAIITIPTGFTSVSIEPVTASDGKSWTGFIESGIKLAATAPQERLDPGQSVTVAFVATAPWDAGKYEWTTIAFVNPSWSGDTFSLEGEQPAVTVSGVPPVSFTITASAGGGGSISPSGDVSVNYGSDQTFDITPDTGYHIADVLVDTVSQGAVSSHTFTSVTADHTISASFAINTFTITASAGSVGSISPSGSVSVNYGSDQGFAITPHANYHVTDVLVDSVSVGALTSYNFTNVVADHTISASFAVDTVPGGGVVGYIPPEPTPSPTPTPTPTPLPTPIEATVFWGIIGGIGHGGDLQLPGTTATPTPATTQTGNESSNVNPGQGAATVSWAMVGEIIGGTLFVALFVFLLFRWSGRPRSNE